MEFQCVTLQDREKMQPFFDAWRLENSELSFTNFFMWRDSCGAAYCIEDGVLYLQMSYCETCPMELYTPLPLDRSRNFGPILDKLVDYQRSIGEPFEIRCVGEPVRARIEEDCPGRFVFTEDRDNFDYLYRSEELISMQGKKLHAKRNHINRFLSMYTYEYREYTKEYLEGCWELYTSWYEHKEKAGVPGMDGEPVATRTTLEYAEELGLKGGVILVDGKVEAFSMGELYRPDMAVIHVEKANNDLQGLYPLMCQQFVANAWSGVPFINREEDMGLEGMRKAKLSLNPCGFVQKYTLRLREE